MKYLTCLLIALTALLNQPVKAQLNDFTKAADQFLKAHVKSGLVDYKAVQQHREQLKGLTRQIAEAAKPAKGPKRKAFYINAYNILAIKSVIAHYPVSGPKAITGFFDGITHEVHGQSLTLNELEKEKLFTQFPDPRVHFAVICAAKGCPPMLPGAYFPEKLDAQLDKQSQNALSDPDFISFDNEARIARISKIFKWYQKDFLQSANSLLDYINRHRSGRLPADTRLQFYPYDWSLNALKKK